MNMELRAADLPAGRRGCPVSPVHPAHKFTSVSVKTLILCAVNFILRLRPLQIYVLGLFVCRHSSPPRPRPGRGILDKQIITGKEVARSLFVR